MFVAVAGSFFKNVFIEKAKLDELLKLYPAMPYFTESADAKALADRNEIIKIPTAWLIEACGWKGKRIGTVGVHDKQALVLVNYGGATGKEIQDLSLRVIEAVFAKFGIKITPEVNLI